MDLRLIEDLLENSSTEAFSACHKRAAEMRGSSFIYNSISSFMFIGLGLVAVGSILASVSLIFLPVATIVVGLSIGLLGGLMVCITPLVLDYYSAQTAQADCLTYLTNFFAKGIEIQSKSALRPYFILQTEVGEELTALPAEQTTATTRYNNYRFFEGAECLPVDQDPDDNLVQVVIDELDKKDTSPRSN